MAHQFHPFREEMVWKKNSITILFVVLFLFLLASIPSQSLRVSSFSSSLVVVEPDTTVLSDDLSSPFLRMFQKPSESNSSSPPEMCDQTYGVMPCTRSAVGNLFLMLVYGYLMFLAATYLSDGSEMLLKILGPGIIGGLFLPVLGALPDALLILVSGLSGNKETVQQQVLIGMGLLAGSTVMLLTVLWGSCVIVGKCDLSDSSTAIDMQDTKKFSLFGSGISTDALTSRAARIMVISVIPFVIVQLPMIFKSTSVGRLTVFIALVVSVVFLFSYCVYQVCQPMIHQRRIEYAQQKYLISKFLEHVQKKGFERILSFAGSPSEDVLRRLFQYVDENGDKLISRPELRALIIGMHIEDAELDGDAATDRLLNAFDLSGDGNINLNEFVSVMMKWLEQAGTLKSRSGRYSGRFIEAFREKSREEYERLLQETEETEESTEDHTWIIFNSVLFLVFGTVIAAVFADPLVDAVHNFSNATDIPSFFISFIAMPLATNSSEAVSSIIFAGRKKKRTASLTFSQIYGAATMNNTLCLSIFLALVYIRDINWDFSSEVLVILLVCVVMGLFASFRTTFQLWTSSVAFLLYPFSLILVYVLDNIFGWS